ncbi:ABC transporter permease [Candidatus Acetothermia bacterium]|nr:ABC transporter permease [Candidatus Acetothermia bacterium]MBI3460751.1 ABC transporter permease [Candidatus Acetothermia bacterium]MBI3660799.1 ABC transporter permease [Candidatus Acetothermia bacterium]
MLGYVMRRLLYMIPTLLVISFVSFAIIQLAPGNYLTQFQGNDRVDQETLQEYAKSLGLDQPFFARYFLWLQNIILHRDFGYSFELHQPVTKLFLDRLPMTLLVTIPFFIITWLVAIPLGIYSATHQYSWGDYSLTVLSFLGLSIPTFVFALGVMYVMVAGFGATSVGGLFTEKYIGAPWSWGKLLDYLWHLLPVLIIAVGSAGSLIRLMRGTLLDVLNQQYVQTARAKGLSERVVLYKHALRNALNIFITILGGSFSGLIAGSLFIAIVLNIPNIELLFYSALRIGDEYVIMTLLLFFSSLLLLGNLFADIMLALVDPRIRYD